MNEINYGNIMSKVYLVGAGPGAPDLLTLRAARLLAQADIVFYDALVHADTIALAANAKKIAVGKRCGQLSTDQRFINRMLVEAATKYQTVVRLKGGDPMLFGRAMEEIDALEKAHIEYEVVPGITAALAASADLKISLTERGLARSVTFATPRVGADENENDWMRRAAASDTTVLYMGVGKSAEVVEALLAQGRRGDTPVVVVENASLPTMRKFVTTLDGLRDAATWGITGPALMLMGEVYRRAMAEALVESMVLQQAKA
jgi:uroporphyrin-III C-methyltransferase